MKDSFKRIFENGIIVSVLLGLAYLFAYIYQKGILSYYKVPLVYINLGIGDIVEIFITIVGVVYFFAIFAKPILDTVSGDLYQSKKLVFALLFFCAFVALNMVIIQRITPVMIIAIGLFIVYVAANLISPLFHTKGKMPYREKWERYSKKREEIATIEANAIKYSRFKGFRKALINLGFTASVIVLIAALYNTAGIDYAQNCEEYYIAKDYSNQVVVYCTSEYYVLMDEIDGILQNKYQIVPAAEIGTLTLEHIGELSIENKS